MQTLSYPWRCDHVLLVSEKWEAGTGRVTGLSHSKWLLALGPLQWPAVTTRETPSTERAPREPGKRGGGKANPFRHLPQSPSLCHPFPARTLSLPQDSASSSTHTPPDNMKLQWWQAQGYHCAFLIVLLVPWQGQQILYKSKPLFQAARSGRKPAQHQLRSAHIWGVICNQEGCKFFFPVLFLTVQILQKQKISQNILRFSRERKVYHLLAPVMMSSAAEGFIQVKRRQSVTFTSLYISKLTEWGRRKLYLALVVCL